MAFTVSSSVQGCTNVGCQTVKVNKLYMVTSEVCGSSVQTLLQDIFMGPRILRWPLGFVRIFAPLLQIMWNEAQALPFFSNALLLTSVWNEGYWLIACTKKSMAQRFSWKSDAHLKIKENSCLSKNPKVHYRAHNSPSLDSSMCRSSTRHMHLFLGYKFYKTPTARLVTRCAIFASTTQNIEAHRYIIYSPGVDLAPGIYVPLSHPTFYIPIVQNKCMFPLGFLTKTLYAVMEKPV